MAAITNLDKCLRHDIRDHLNSIHIQAETILMISSESDCTELAQSQINIIHKIQQLLDLTKQPTETANPNN